MPEPLKGKRRVVKIPISMDEFGLPSFETKAYFHEEDIKEAVEWLLKRLSQLQEYILSLDEKTYSREDMLDDIELIVKQAFPDIFEEEVKSE